MSFADLAEVHRAYDSRQVELNARIWVRIREKKSVNPRRNGKNHPL